MANKPKPNFKPFGNKKPKKPKSIIDELFSPSKGQDSRKVHDTKGKNNHGRKQW